MVVVVGLVIIVLIVAMLVIVLPVIVHIENKQVFFHPTMGGVILRLGTLPEPRESENTFLGGCSSAAQLH